MSPATVGDVERFERLTKLNFPDDYRAFLLALDFERDTDCSTARIDSGRSTGWFDHFEPLHVKEQPFGCLHVRDDRGARNYNFEESVVIAVDRNGCPWVLSLRGPDRGYVYHCPNTGYTDWSRKQVGWRDPGLIVASSFTEFGELVIRDELPDSDESFETVYRAPSFWVEEADPTIVGAVATIESIVRFEDRIGHRLPDDYRAFLMTEPPVVDPYNDPVPTAQTPESTVEFGQFLALGAADPLDRIKFNSWTEFPDSVEFAVDAGHQGLIMSLAGPDRGYVYHCADGTCMRHPDYIVASTFTEFLELLGFAS